MGSTISTTLTEEVILGGTSAGAYASPLTITSSGAIEPTATGITALYSDTAGVSVTNSGTVRGGAGALDATAGYGIEFTAASTITNYGHIYGGVAYGSGGTGGVGVLAADATFENQGLIKGGTGEGSGDGGVGVDLTGGSFTEAKIATIYGGKAEGSGNGGTGLVLNGTTGTIGSLENEANLRIFGGNAYGSGSAGTGAQLIGSATLTNYGDIGGGEGAGAESGAGIGVILGTGATLKNFDGVSGGGGRPATGPVGLQMAAGSTLDNYGEIIGGFGPTRGGDGVDMLAQATLVNVRGTIWGDSGYSGGMGVYLADGGGLKVEAGIIEGGGAVARDGVAGTAGTGVYAKGSGTGGANYVSNSGSISGGVETNYLSSPSIGGTGVIINAGIKLTNNNSIEGGEDSRSTTSTSTQNVGGTGLIINGSSAYNLNASSGLIEGGLGAGGATGGVGLKLLGSGAVLYNQGMIEGGSDVQNNTPTAAGIGAEVYAGTRLFNYGTLSGGALESSGGVTQTGGVGAPGVVIQGGTVYNAGVIAATGDPVAVQFVGAGGALVFEAHGGTYGTLNGTVAGFQSGDKIEFLDTELSQISTSGSLSAGTYSITTPHDGTITFSGTYTGVLQFSSIDGGTAVEVQAPCYRRGTRIRTQQGERAIEVLRIGDQVCTLGGEICPIRWIGRRRYRGGYLRGNRAVQPVRIERGALGANVPSRDLWVSPEHALYIDGMLIPAAALVNGESIRQERGLEEIEYFHLEFDTHAVIYAEGATAESYADDDSRQMFDNAAEYSQLYPRARRDPVQFCAPRVEEGEVLEAVRRRLAEVSDWA